MIASPSSTTAKVGFWQTLRPFLPLICVVVLFACATAWLNVSPRTKVLEKFNISAAGTTQKQPLCATELDVPVNASSPGAQYVESITHCSNGYFGEITINLVEDYTTAKFRCPIVGSEVFLMEFEYTGLNQYKGNYYLESPGQYVLELIFLYNVFNSTSVKSSPVLALFPPLVVNYPLRNAEQIQLTNTAGSSNIAKMDQLNGQHAQHMHSRAVLDSHVYRGRWKVYDDSIKKYLSCTRMAGSQSKATPPCLDWPEDHSLIFDIIPPDNPGLYYEFEEDVVDYARNPDEARLCLQDVKMCFWGDSQTRHTYDNIIAVMEDITFIERKQVLNASSFQIKFMWKTFASFEKEVEEIASHCTHMIVNTGQWPASKEQFLVPWTFERYRIYLDADMQFLTYLAKKVRGLKVYWATTNPVGFSSMTAFNGDWRTPPVLKMYNQIAREVARNHRIHLIDTYRIGNPLADLAYDWAHYIGSVSWAITNAMLHAICKAP